MTNSTTTSYNPMEDGVTHINAYSKGRTPLGRLLSNFAHTPFRHPTLGHFASVEGYWYWCGSGRSHDHLRRLHGMSAKSAGVKCEVVPIPESEFQQMIEEGIRAKVDCNADIKQQLRASHLPIVHYFVYGDGTKAVIVHQDKHDWQMQLWEQIRRELKGEVPSEVVVYFTPDQWKASGYELSGLTHHNTMPTTDELHTYARTLHWSSLEIEALPTSASSWILVRRKPSAKAVAASIPDSGDLPWDNA